MSATAPLKFRVHPWLDTKMLKPLWGVQCLHRGRWKHVCDGDRALIFQVEAECKAYVAEMNAHVRKAAVSTPSAEKATPT